MSETGGMFPVLGECVAMLATRQPAMFGFTVFLGVVLAAACWWICTHYSRLWNLTFRITRLHQILCAGAAALTLVFWILFVSLQYTRQVAQDAIDGWHREVESDPVFHRQTKQRIYYMVKATNQEDFRKYPAPETVAGEALVPVSKPGSKKILASVIANEALKRFRQEQPFLSEVLSLPERIPDAVLVTDMTNYFAARPHGGTYPFNHALDLTADQIKARLDPETPRVVVVARLILTGCFLLAQAIPFCLIGLAATRDLKVST
ncbi:MAG: hypothetical protein ABSC65_06910 [Acidobacteriaceae bacterium]|jgi:hypothetical protein